MSPKKPKKKHADPNGVFRGGLTTLGVQSKSSAKEITTINPCESKRPNHLVSVRFTSTPASLIELQFTDKCFTIATERLGMPVDSINWQTAKASSTGEAMTVKGVKGELIPIDSASLRYLVDGEYAAKIDASIISLHMTPAEFDETARLSLNPAWHDVGDENDLL